MNVTKWFRQILTPFVGCGAIVLGMIAPRSASAESLLPNIVFILCDNLGNGDIGCFYPQAKQRTPKIDAMAAEGRRFTSFYSASGVCTPSRAALMTGAYPIRIGMETSYEGYSVLKPVDKRGLHPDEETMAEILHRAGYTTACFGKWHLGDQHPFLPKQQGFKRFLGIPYSEDMLPGIDPNRPWPPLPLMEDNRVIEAPVDAQYLTKRLTEAAIRFIEENRDSPFFLYFPETGPGSRRECYPGPDFRGRSANGLYGDSIEELDWSCGEILHVLDRLGLREKTLVVWTNDNGALRRDPQEGSNAPYQGFGNSTSEGAMRMPCIARWPSKVPAGTVCDELCTMMDWLPTLAKLAGEPMPTKPIDGYDLSPLLFGEKDATSSYDASGFFYYHTQQLRAVRSGPWKLYLAIDALLPAAKNSRPARQELALFNVRDDLAESVECSRDHPEVVQRLISLADSAKARLGDGDRIGSERRPSGWVDAPVPAILPPQPAP